MNKTVLLKGGTSEEREVSLATCAAIEAAFQRLGRAYETIDPADFVEKEKINYFSFIDKLIKLKPSIVFNGLHGGDGENGEIQKILAENNLPYSGSDQKACALAMDKFQSKTLAKKLKIPVPDFLKFEKGDKIFEEKIIDSLGPTLVVKPNSSGSSVGISIVQKKSQLSPAIKKALEFDNCILIEKFIPNREITVAILGETALPVVEIKAKNGWYDYLHKYTKGKTIYETPAQLSPKHSRLIQNYAEKIFTEMGCADYARVDFRFDGSKFYFLELNTLPGMTDLSLVPMAAKANGIGFDELIERICDRDFF